MLVTIEIDPARRTAAFREVSYLAAGDSCRVVLDGVRGADFASLGLMLYRDAASESPVASCAAFSAVPGHPSLADGELALDTFEMAEWYADAVPDGESDSDSGPAVPRGEPRLAARASLAERSVRAGGWLVVSDSDRVWAACGVPVLLRPGAGTSGASDPASVRALVSELVAGLVSAALADKADKVPSAAAGNLASLDSSGNLADSGATPASIKAAAVAEVVANAPGTMDTLKEIADILGSSQQSGTVLKRISELESGKVDKEAGKGLVAVDAALATQGAAADAKAVGDALRSGFTEWQLSGVPEGWVLQSVELIRVSLMNGTRWRFNFTDTDPDAQHPQVRMFSDQTDPDGIATSLTFTGGTGTGRGANMTAIRSLVTPTRTSQLVNDGDGTVPFARSLFLVEPGAWRFSGSGVYGNRVFSVELSSGDYGHKAVLVEDGEPVSEVVQEADFGLTVDFFMYGSPRALVVAHRDSLPGHLVDQAVNAVAVSSATELTLPPAVAGTLRDFYLKLTVTGSQAVSFSPSSGVAYTGYGNPAKTYSAGTYLLRFTETAEAEFRVEDAMASADPVRRSEVSVSAVGSSVYYDLKDVTLKSGTTVRVMGGVALATASQAGRAMPDGTTTSAGSDGKISVKPEILSYSKAAPAPVNGVVTLVDRALNRVEPTVTVGAPAWTWSDGLAHGTPAYLYNEGYGGNMWGFDDGNGGHSYYDALGNYLEWNWSGDADSEEVSFSYYDEAEGNYVTLTATLETPYVSDVTALALPGPVSGKVRDFMVRLVVPENMPAFAWPANVAYETEDGQMPDVSEPGVYLLAFTETGSGRFALLCRKVQGVE